MRRSFFYGFFLLKPPRRTVRETYTRIVTKLELDIGDGRKDSTRLSRRFLCAVGVSLPNM